jgi:streptomycin 3"-adenylyltransferase
VSQIERVVDVVRHVLGDDVLGVYLTGSAVVGELRPTSDLDFIVVSRRSMTVDAKHSLIASLLSISGGADHTSGSRSIDLAIVVQADVRPWSYPPPMDLQYGDWWKDEFEHGEMPWESPNPDLTILIAMVLESGHPLVGPPPSALLDPVPPGDVRRALIDVIPALRSDLDGDERNVVLTFARIWATLTIGRILSKDAAADWALPRLPAEHQGVLAHARAIYVGDANEDWGDVLPHVGPHVDHVIARIMSTAAGNASVTSSHGKTGRPARVEGTRSPSLAPPGASPLPPGAPASPRRRAPAPRS